MARLTHVAVEEVAVEVVEVEVAVEVAVAAEKKIYSLPPRIQRRSRLAFLAQTPHSTLASVLRVVVAAAQAEASSTI